MVSQSTHQSASDPKAQVIFVFLVCIWIIIASLLSQMEAKHPHDLRHSPDNHPQLRHNHEWNPSTDGIHESFVNALTHQ